jgi:hypothetical protein
MGPSASSHLEDERDEDMHTAKLIYKRLRERCIRREALGFL